MRTARRAALALGFAALALVALPAAAQEDVPLSWILAPDGVDRGDTFRLMFVTSSKRAGNSDSIGNYNSIVRTDAGDGHPGIYEFRDDFNAVASTESTDARDNTDTNPNSDGAGEPIYWLGGAKVADNYADFYDGSWDSNARVWESGARLPRPGTGFIWTGSDDNGTEAASQALRSRGGLNLPVEGYAARMVNLESSQTELSGSSRGITRQGHFYGLSPVFEVQSAPNLIDAKITSRPRSGNTFYRNEVIEVTLTFDEPVKFQGSAGDAADLYLHIGQSSGGDNKAATYLRQDSPNTLTFGRTVGNNDRDTGGVCLGWGCSGDSLGGTNKFRSSIDNAISPESRLSFDRHSTSLRVDGRSTGLTGGVCDRTWAVREKMVADYSKSNCSQVTDANLAGDTALTVDGSNSSYGPVSAFAKRDFEGMDALTTLELPNHNLDGLAETMLDHVRDTLLTLELNGNDIERATGTPLRNMSGLRNLRLNYNDISRLDAEFLEDLDGLFVLNLQYNELASLPHGIFEHMTVLDTLWLSDNPGAGTFLPATRFTSGSETQTVNAGAAVEIAVEPTPGQNPWGTNVLYSWERIDSTGVAVAMSGTDSGTLSFTAPALDSNRTLRFRVTVKGKGTEGFSSPLQVTLTTDVTVRRAANVPTVTGVDIVSTPEVGDTYYAGETVELEIAYSEDVAVTTRTSGAFYPRVWMLLGGTGNSNVRAFVYDRTEDGNRLIFTYTVARNVSDSDGIALCPVTNAECDRTLDLSNPPGAATITALDDGTDASTDFVIPAPWSGHKVGSRTNPGIAGIAVTSAPPGDVDDTFRRDETIEATVTWDEDIRVLDATGSGNGIVLKVQLKSAGGANNTRDFQYLRRPSPRTMVFGYTVQSADADDNGLCIGEDCAADSLVLQGSAKIRAVFGSSVNAARGHDAVQTTWKVDGSMAGLTGGVCGRTVAVRDKLVAAAPGADDCSDVSDFRLEQITALDLSGLSLAGLQAGDLDGLIALTSLDLSDNALAALPAGIFDDLTALATLDLGDNALASLPSGVFSPFAAALTTLNLGGNPMGSLGAGTFAGLSSLLILDLADLGLSTLPGGVFAGLSALRELDLKENSLATLPAAVFRDLTALTLLELDDNDLTSLPANLFQGLASLEELDLRTNELASLPQGVFRDLSALETLNIRDNGLNALPDGVFEALAALEALDFSGNPGAADFVPGFSVVGPASVRAQALAALVATPGTNPWGSNVVWSWTRTDTAPVTLTLTGADAAALGFEAPSLAAAADVAFSVTGTGRGTAVEVVKSRAVTIEATASLSTLAVTSVPLEGGVHYRGEVLEMTATFTERVFVNGAPELGVKLGAGTGGTSRKLVYTRGTGTAELVFAYTVAQSDRDDDGITSSGALDLANGATIRNALGENAVLAYPTVRHVDAKVDGRTAVATGGICDRTREVHAKLVALTAGVSSCADMDAAALAAIPASLQFRNLGITALKPGDFDGLGHVTSLSLAQNALTDITPGVLDPLTGLTELYLSSNAIARVPAGIFDELTELTILRLSDNAIATVLPGAFDRLTKLLTLGLEDNHLAALPDGIFEPLTALSNLRVDGNPGSADFRPSAVAVLPNGETGIWEGRTIELDASASTGGPWGSNLVYAWAVTGPVEGGFADPEAARTTVTFTKTLGAGPGGGVRLRVYGRGHSVDFPHGEASVTLGVDAQPTVTGVEFTSRPRSNPYTYWRGEPIEVTVTYSAPVTVTGMPYVPIILANNDAADDDLRQAVYDRAGAGNRLVFAYTVESDDASGEDIYICTSSLGRAECDDRIGLPAGAAIADANGRVPAKLDFTGLAPGLHQYNVNGLSSASGGPICERTPAVREAIVEAFEAKDDNISHCADVTDAVLAGSLNNGLSIDVSDAGVSALQPGDFADLNLDFVDLSGNALSTLTPAMLPDNGYIIDLSGNALTAIPAGLFQGVAYLGDLYLNDNDIRTVAPDAFAGMTGLDTLLLRNNALAALPDAVFEDLTGLSVLNLTGNPGSADFKPGVTIGGYDNATDTLHAGQPWTLTAGVTGPWGSNVSHVWSNDSRNLPQVTLRGAGTAAVSFDAPSSSRPLRLDLTVTGRGGSAHSASASVNMRLEEAPHIAAVAVTSQPRTASGPDADTYGAGETIELTVTYSEPVTVIGTPYIQLAIGSDTRNADYARQASAWQLVFAYTVQAADRDNDGFEVADLMLALPPGASIVNAYGVTVDYGFQTLTVTGHRSEVDGGVSPPAGGICARSVPVRTVLLLRVEAADSAVGTCADVTAAHLGALTGTLTVSAPVLEAGDFAGLGNVTGLDLSGGGLLRLPAGVFDGLVRLETLRLENNDLASVASGAFDALVRLETLHLHDNALVRLPAGAFERLAALDDLRLGNNNSPAPFAPVARAEADADAATGGQTVRLDGTGSDTGPWGTNVTWSWERVDAQGNALSPDWLSGAATVRADATVPPFTAAGTARFRLRVIGRGVDRGNGDAAHATSDTVALVIRERPAVESVRIVSRPGAGVTYRAGETIEVALGYTAAVTVTGTPAIALLVGDAFAETAREAGYLRTEGGRRLVFGYTVVAADGDDDGIRGCETAQAQAGHCAAGVLLDAGEAVTAADGMAAETAFTAFARQDGHRIDGSLNPGTGGICARTAAVRAAIVAAIPGESACAGVDAAELAAITGTLDVSDAGLTALASGDLDGLAMLTRLDLSGNGLSALPPGIFGELAALVSLDLSDNALASVPGALTELAAVSSFDALDLSGNRIAALPADAFGTSSGALELATLDLSGNELARIDAETFTPGALHALEVLDLRANRLAALPEGVFEPLAALTDLDLRDNPGTAGFVPVAAAGADIAEAGTGLDVTLGASATGPWGGGVDWAWTQVSGPAVTLRSALTAQPEFTAPGVDADTDLVFRATATGRGTAAAASDTVEVTVAPAPGANAIAVISSPVSGSTYGAGETIEVRVGFSHAVEVAGGTPSLRLDIGGAMRLAGYARGSGTKALVFAWTVTADDDDTDGIASCTGAVDTACDGALALGPGETIRSAANGLDAALAHPALGTRSGHKVDGAQQGLTGGICARTPKVRDRILQTLSNAGVSVADCSAVGAAELERVEILAIQNTALSSLKPDDFAGLVNVIQVAMHGNRNLTALPAGLLDPLPKLANAYIQNNALTTLPAGLFDNNPGLELVYLYNNGLTALPAGLFDRNPKLAIVRLGHNPGLSNSNRNRLSDLPDGLFAHNPLLEQIFNFVVNGNASGFIDRITPVADAGADFTAHAGETVTLDASASTSRVFGANVTHVWRQSDSSGLGAAPVQGAVSHGAFRGPRGTVTLPAVTAPTELELTVRVQPLWTDDVRSEDSVRVTVLPRAFASGLRVLSRPLGGDTYRLGETIEAAVRYSEPVTVTGTPALQLRIGSAIREAAYRESRDAGRVLVFAWEVVAADREAVGLRSCPAGVSGCSGAIALETGEAIAATGSMAAAGLDVPELGYQPAHKVDGSMARPTGGVCARTPEVRIALTAAVGAASCAGVTTAALGAVSGTLDLAGLGIDALAAGDFTGLGALTGLDLSSNALAALPDGVFEPLGALATLDLSGNPGAFAPVADAGADLAEQAPGARVALDGAATSGGPWGSNVAYAWQRIDTVSFARVTLEDADTAAPAFDAPVVGSAHTLAFRLTVTGRGGAFASRDKVSVPVAAAIGPEPGMYSAPRANATYALGETVEVYMDYAEPVTITGTPGLDLQIGESVRRAFYDRTVDGGRLVYAYTVQAADRDTNGLKIGPDSATLLHPIDIGGAIAATDGAAVVTLAAVRSATSAHKVDGSTTLASGGICGRTAQVADAIVAAVGDAAVDGCDDVTAAHLAGVASLRLNRVLLTGLAAGDFAGMTGLTSLRITGNAALRTLPADLLDGLAALETLELSENRLRTLPADLLSGKPALVGFVAQDNALTTLPPGFFAGAPALVEVQLEDNALATLPAGVFAPLAAIEELHLAGNPGVDGFKPVAAAGPDRSGLEPGATVPLDATASDGGPWGTNLEYQWSQDIANDPAEIATWQDERSARASFTVPETTAAARYAISVQVQGAGASNVFQHTDTFIMDVAAAPVVETVTIASSPPAPPSYRAGEAIEVAATFSEDVEVTGTPTFPLDIGSATRAAAYLRESTPGVLVFAWTVQADDLDTDGIASAGATIGVPAGAAIVSAASQRAAATGYTAFANQVDHLVDGRVAAPGGGVCGRTPAIRDAIVAATGAGSCAAVRDADLAAVTALDASGGGLTAIAGGDFAGLDALTGLDLSGNAIAALTAGLFDELAALETLDLSGNNLATLPAGLFAGLAALKTLDLGANLLVQGALPAGLFDDLTALRRLELNDNAVTELPAGLFDALTALRRLDLRRMELGALPDGIFEKLTALTSINLAGNAASVNRVRPLAAAGPDPLRVAPGTTVTLDGTGSNGRAWGSNFTYFWRGPAGVVEFDDPTSATPSFTAPVLGFGEEISITVGVHGRGMSTGDDTDSVVYGGGNSDPAFADTMVTRAVEENSAPGTAVGAPVTASDPNGDALTYSLEGANAELFAIVPATGQIEVSAALDYELKTSHALVVRASDTHGGSGTVAVTVEVGDVTGPADPPTPGLGEAAVETVTLSSVPALAEGYRIGETVRAAVTFSKAVELVGAAGEVTLALDIGRATRRAAYAGGSGTAVWTFAYEVADGDRDGDGVSVAADAIATGDASIEAGGMAAALAHDALGDDGAQKVDGVRPAFSGAAAIADTRSTNPVAGLAVVEVRFSEALRATAFGDADKYRVSDNLDRTLAIAEVRLSPDDAKAVEIVLTAPVGAGSAVALAYNALAGAFAFTRATDAAGNTAASFGPVAVDTGMPADDATLDRFRLRAGGANLAFTPAFAPAVTAYRASVANATASVALEVRTADANATVAIAGDDDTATPATATVALAEGANTVAATVTAEDGVAQRTYSAVVVRAAGAPAPDPDALWTARMTVGESGAKKGYDGFEGYGALAPDVFDLGGGMVAGASLFYTQGRITFSTIAQNGASRLNGRYRLEISSRAFEFTADGTADDFEVAATDPGWGFGEIAPVKLVAVDTAPVFVGSGISVAENTRGQTALGSLFDAPQGDALTYSIAGGVDAGLFEIAGGAIRFRSAPDFEAPEDIASTDPADAAGNNVHLVQVRASDGANATVATLRITVTNVGEFYPFIRGLWFSQASSTAMNLYWSEPEPDPNEGYSDAITGYDVQYKLATASVWTDFSHSGTANTATITGLTSVPPTSYNFRIRSRSGTGAGSWFPGSVIMGGQGRGHQRQSERRCLGRRGRLGHDDGDGGQQAFAHGECAQLPGPAAAGHGRRERLRPGRQRPGELRSQRYGHADEDVHHRPRERRSRRERGVLPRRAGRRRQRLGSARQGPGRHREDHHRRRRRQSRPDRGGGDAGVEDGGRGCGLGELRARDRQLRAAVGAHHGALARGVGDGGGGGGFRRRVGHGRRAGDDQHPGPRRQPGRGRRELPGRDRRRGELRGVGRAGARGGFRRRRRDRPHGDAHQQRPAASARDIGLPGGGGDGGDRRGHRHARERTRVRYGPDDHPARRRDAAGVLHVSRRGGHGDAQPVVAERRRVRDQGPDRAAGPAGPAEHHDRQRWFRPPHRDCRRDAPGGGEHRPARARRGRERNLHRGAEPGADRRRDGRGGAAGGGRLRRTHHHRRRPASGHHRRALVADLYHGRLAHAADGDGERSAGHGRGPRVRARHPHALGRWLRQRACRLGGRTGPGRRERVHEGEALGQPRERPGGRGPAGDDGDRGAQRRRVLPGDRHHRVVRRRAGVGVGELRAGRGLRAQDPARGHGREHVPRSHPRRRPDRRARRAGAGDGDRGAGRWPHAAGDGRRIRHYRRRHAGARGGARVARARRGPGGRELHGAACDAPERRRHGDAVGDGGERSRAGAGEPAVHALELGGAAGGGGERRARRRQRGGHRGGLARNGRGGLRGRQLPRRGGGHGERRRRGRGDGGAAGAQPRRGDERELFGGAARAADGRRDHHALGAAGHRRGGHAGAARVRAGELGPAARLHRHRARRRRRGDRRRGDGDACGRRRRLRDGRGGAGDGGDRGGGHGGGGGVAADAGGPRGRIGDLQGGAGLGAVGAGDGHAGDAHAGRDRGHGDAVERRVRRRQLGSAADLHGERRDGCGFRRRARADRARRDRRRLRGGGGRHGDGDGEGRRPALDRGGALGGAGGGVGECGPLGQRGRGDGDGHARPGTARHADRGDGLGRGRDRRGRGRGRGLHGGDGLHADRPGERGERQRELHLLAGERRRRRGRRDGARERHHGGDRSHGRGHGPRHRRGRHAGDLRRAAGAQRRRGRRRGRDLRGVARHRADRQRDGDGDAGGGDGRARRAGDAHLHAHGLGRADGHDHRGGRRLDRGSPGNGDPQRRGRRL